MTKVLSTLEKWEVCRDFRVSTSRPITIEEFLADITNTCYPNGLTKEKMNFELNGWRLYEDRDDED